MPATPSHPTHRLSRRAHGLMDYIYAALLLASPLFIPYANQHLASEIATTLGLVTLVLSLVTHYELGAIPLVPFRGHLLFDVLISILLLGSPWHFGIGGAPAVFFCTMGAIGLIVVATTQRPAPSRTAT